MMKVSKDFERFASVASQKLSRNEPFGMPIPEMDGYFVALRGESPYQDNVQAIMTREDGTEYEVYTNGANSS